MKKMHNKIIIENVFPITDKNMQKTCIFNSSSEIGYIKLGGMGNGSKN